ncbi:MAG: hypothetical protein UU02_C0023G0012 [Candidatus Woesebacteria bacterium GW2011_GWA1_40_43]|uniref:ADP-ribosylation/Crystallin J1 n=1 Tax=Candidatus Woesebacteria bacterium GW2011_GWA1_40_43 TaxID=1618553 RepID=A0A0G0SFF8_9BACT|nr:MAG: hypothetical protein UT88_C0001G0004 [Candidatus Woesebacteria bacterium GW2011_GWD2_40_19]KKR57087.1 MAG: hypothetical protein UT96_C0027G0016 [Candidatus Woesebacteria bacterium GW2011_GWC2_40_30]KKR63534.1 MAG: hypothetical protein UU02_C0023G0012 [Candidatus Woesebacteria bacterium GW2011_GWA1_40_43]HAU65557.1 hypothetical protein [Candidatus Woesebacteria bacterium]
MARNKNSLKITGAILGFAIGDSMGFPAAGIKKSDYLKTNIGEIVGFTRNQSHPFFYTLNEGQFTDNTRLFLLTIESLIKNKGYYENDMILNLKKWAKNCRDIVGFERWPGKTSLRACINLLNGHSPKDSGAKLTSSCASVYRTLPIGIFFCAGDAKSILNYSEICASYTHNSIVSRNGSVFAAISVAKILNGAGLEQSFSDSLSIIENYGSSIDSRKLIERIRWSLNNYKKVGVQKARKLLGTGSSILQTIPLAVYISLKSNKFEDGVLTAANSFREDFGKEKRRMLNYGWTEQLLECVGGNTDGIAAICGCFLGALHGIGGIPDKYRTIENYSEMYNLKWNLK